MIELVEADTGFQHFGPMMKCVPFSLTFSKLGALTQILRSMCGEDTRGNITFPVRSLSHLAKLSLTPSQLVKELYNIFVGQLCPPEGHLVRPLPLFSSFLADSWSTVGLERSVRRFEAEDPRE